MRGTGIPACVGVAGALPRLAVLCLILACALSARTLPIRRFETNLVPLSIAQDREGFLWIAAPGGVWRFDGLHYEPVEAPSGIDLSTATHIAAGRDGAIWIATAQGLIRYRDGSFSVAMPGPIGALIVTRAGRLLAVPESRIGLNICLEPDRNPCQWSRLRGLTATGEFHEDQEGKVWFGASANVCSWSDTDVKAAAEGKSWSELPCVASVAPVSGEAQWFDWADIVAAPDHRIWGRNGPDVLRFGNGRILSRTSLPVETFGGVRPAFYPDRRGRIWIPGRQLSLVENGVLRALDSSPPLENVTAVFEDRVNTLWFGVAGKGLVALPDEASLEAWSQAEGISGSVLDLAAHPSLGLVAATDAGALALTRDQQHWQAVPALSGIAERSVAARDDGALLLLPHEGGLWLSEAPFRSARELPLPAGLGRTRLKKLFRDSQGAIWMGTLDGLFRIDPLGRVQQVPLPAHGVHVSDFWADSEGQLWVGYEGGVARCRTGVCEPVITPEDGLLDPRIRSIAPCPGGIWIGYRQGDGYSRFAQRAGGWSVTHFKPRNGYGPIDTHFVRRDRRGWIWRGSTDGVYVSDGKSTSPEDWIHLTFGDRVNASYAHMYGFFEDAGGSIWIGTQAGVVRLRPGADWFAPAPVRIHQIRAAESGGDVEIHLSQPGLPVFESRLFRYRMAPLDSQWRFSSDGTLHYSKLRASSYRLQVASGFGAPPVEYVFRVEGAFLSRIPLWSWLLIAVAAAAALILRVTRRRRSGQRYWEEKQKFLEDREKGEDWSGRVLDGRFLLESRIASGGFAAVYRAVDRSANQAVAVKLLHPLRDHTEWRRRRFVDEVAALRKLQDPGVVRIRHAGDAAPDQPYLVMEFIDGVTLRALLADGPLALERAASLIEQIGSAVAAAHRAGILHRDLKPENVMVRDAGAPGERVTLIDFGIANTQTERTTTHSTELAGSPGYVAPERWVGLESFASDIYSLAAIAREMLTGPIPPAAADLLAAGLEYDPEKRPAGAAPFARDLCACLLFERVGPDGIRRPIVNRPPGKLT